MKGWTLEPLETENEELCLWILFFARKVFVQPLFIYFYIAIQGHIVEPSEYPYKNIALHKPAWQSSTRSATHPAHAARAVDGSHDPRFALGSCTHTRTEDYPTWVVDLGYLSQIYMVNVTNRKGVLSIPLETVNHYTNSMYTRVY